MFVQWVAYGQVNLQAHRTDPSPAATYARHWHWTCRNLDAVNGIVRSAGWLHTFSEYDGPVFFSSNIFNPFEWTFSCKFYQKKWSYKHWAMTWSDIVRQMYWYTAAISLCSAKIMVSPSNQESREPHLAGGKRYSTEWAMPIEYRIIYIYIYI